MSENVKPADAALLRECADPFQWKADGLRGFDPPEVTAECELKAARLRALADVLEKWQAECAVCGARDGWHNMERVDNGMWRMCRGFLLGSPLHP